MERGSSRRPLSDTDDDVEWDDDDDDVNEGTFPVLQTREQLSWQRVYRMLNAGCACTEILEVKNLRDGRKSAIRHRCDTLCCGCLQNGDAAERKYAPAAFEAAGLAVAGLLRLLAAEGFYAKEDLAPGLAIAEQAAVELPRCAVRGRAALLAAAVPFWLVVGTYCLSPACHANVQPLP